MSRCQYCTNPGRKRLYKGIAVWLCKRHWRELRSVEREIDAVTRYINQKGSK